MEANTVVSGDNKIIGSARGQRGDGGRGGIARVDGVGVMAGASTIAKVITSYAGVGAAIPTEPEIGSGGGSGGHNQADGEEAGQRIAEIIVITGHAASYSSSRASASPVAAFSSP